MKFKILVVLICLWNSFNAVESKKIIIPDEIASAQSGKSIQYLKFPFADKKEILLVVITNGDCYILETQSEKWLEFNYDQEPELDERDIDGSDEEPTEEKTRFKKSIP